MVKLYLFVERFQSWNKLPCTNNKTNIIIKIGEQKKMLFVFVIKEIRQKKGISIYKLNKLTGLSYSYLHDLENNKIKNPSLATMDKIANALKVDIKKLYFGPTDIEKLKKEMYNCIEQYGINAQKTREYSELIDKLINIAMFNK